MIELLITFLTSGGSVGFGSLLKIGAGFIDTWNRNKEVENEAKLLREVKEKEFDIEYFKLIYGDSTGASYARATRRLVALIGMCVFGTICILCALYPSVSIITFVPREIAGEGYSLLWGLISTPNSKPILAQISTGHIAIMGVISLQVILGFYFTPGGRK